MKKKESESIYGFSPFLAKPWTIRIAPVTFRNRWETLRTRKHGHWKLWAYSILYVAWIPWWSYGSTVLWCLRQRVSRSTTECTWFILAPIHSVHSTFQTASNSLSVTELCTYHGTSYESSHSSKPIKTTPINIIIN